MRPFPLSPSLNRKSRVALAGTTDHRVLVVRQPSTAKSLCLAIRHLPLSPLLSPSCQASVSRRDCGRGHVLEFEPARAPPGCVRAYVRARVFVRLTTGRARGKWKEGRRRERTTGTDNYFDSGYATVQDPRAFVCALARAIRPPRRGIARRRKGKGTGACAYRAGSSTRTVRLFVYLSASVCAPAIRLIATESGAGSWNSESSSGLRDSGSSFSPSRYHCDAMLSPPSPLNLSLLPVDERRLMFCVCAGANSREQSGPVCVT